MPISAHFAPQGLVRGLVYRLLWGCANVLQKVANGCLYFAAGLLRRDDLLTISQLRWQQFTASSDDADAGLEMWERRFYGEVLQPSDRVLVVGCGTGRELLALCELGFKTTGVEPVPEAVNLAHRHLAEHGVTATVVAGFIETVDPGGCYDAVIFSAGVYAYVLQSASRVAMLARLRARLSSNGRIAISYTGRRPRSRFAEWLPHISARLARADWQPEPGDSFSRDFLGHRILRYEHTFGPGDVARECAAAGFRIVRDEAVIPSSLYGLIAVPVTERSAPGHANVDQDTLSGSEIGKDRVTHGGEQR